MLKCDHMDSEILTTIKRQIPFLIGGTVTGVIMTYYLGFPVTIIVNSIIWFLISYITYRRLWKKNGLTDQKILLRYFLTKINFYQKRRA
jgi:p-aminobenzoyl-glutamate transporter AbgT